MMDKANSGVFENCNNHIREKLVELLDEVLDECELVCERSNCPHFPLPSCVSTKQAYHLIANGVTITEKSSASGICKNCNDHTPPKGE